MALVEHTLPPIYDENSRVLILGTMPSPKSREDGFYYGHPQNRFWKVLADLFNEKSLITKEEKMMFLHRHHLALWDVLKSCEIEGADDSSIKQPVPNDLDIILKEAKIEAIFTTGKKATDLYMKYIYPKTNLPAIGLPSTSPANRRISYEQLKESYAKILDYLPIKN